MVTCDKQVKVADSPKVSLKKIGLRFLIVDLPAKPANKSKQVAIQIHWGYTLAELRPWPWNWCNEYFTKTFFHQNSWLSTGVPRCRLPPKIAARWRYRLPSNNLTAHYDSQFFVRFHFGFARKSKNSSKCVWIGPKHNFVHFKSLWGCLLIDSLSRVHPLYAGKIL